MIKSDIVYNPSVPLKYATKGGEVLEARFISMYAPTVKSLRHVAPLKQTFLRAIASQNSTLSSEDREKAELEREVRLAAGKKDEALTGEAVLSMLMMSEAVDYSKFLEDFIKALKEPSLALVDGETPISDSFLHLMPLTDLEALAGEYMVNFTVPSALKE